MAVTPFITYLFTGFLLCASVLCLTTFTRKHRKKRYHQFLKFEEVFLLTLLASTVLLCNQFSTLFLSPSLLAILRDRESEFLNEEDLFSTLCKQNKKINSTTVFGEPGKWPSKKVLCDKTSRCYYNISSNAQKNKSDTTFRDSSYLYLVLTSDVHGHVNSDCRTFTNIKGRGRCYPGASSLATVLKKLKDKPFLLLDTGDFLFGANEYNSSFVVDVMNHLGYHATGFGNHDWDVGRNELKQFFHRANFPVLAANVIDENEHFKNYSDFPFRRYLQVELEYDIYVCIIGVTTSELNPLALRAIQEEDSVLQYAKTLIIEGSCHHTIILSHAGINIDQRLANMAFNDNKKKVDLVLGGHSHFITGSKNNHPESVEFGYAIPGAPFFYRIKDAANDSAPIVHIGSNGRYAGLIKLTLTKKKNGISNIEKMDGQLLPLDEKSGIFPDKEMESWIKNNSPKSQERKELNERSVSISVNVKSSNGMTPKEEGDSIEVCGYSCRKKECLLGNIITDAMRQTVIRRRNNITFLGGENQYPVIALIESGTLRECVMTNQHETFRSVLPWSNHLVLLTVNGSTLLNILQHGVQQPGGGAFLQVSGIQYSFGNLQHQHSIILQAGVVEHHLPRQRKSATGNVAVFNIDIYDDLSREEIYKGNNNKFSFKPINNNSYYNIVVTNWLASGGDGFGPLLSNTTFEHRMNNTILRHILLDYIQEFNPNIQIEGRILYSDTKDKTRSNASASSNAISGLIGGYIAYFASYPFYTLFVRKSVYSNKRSGVSKSGLFQGVWLGSLATALCQFIYFLIYHSEWLENTTSNFVRSSIGAISTALFTNPIWVLVTRMQVMEYRSISHAVQAVLKDSGWRGFSKGMLMNLTMSCFPVIRQIVMEYILLLLFNTEAGDKNASATHVAFSAGIGACVATLVTVPLQRWRVRLQQGLADGISISNICDGFVFKTIHSAFSSFILFLIKVSVDDINQSGILDD